MPCSSCGQKQKQAQKESFVKLMFNYVEPEVQKERYKICRGCEFFRLRTPEVLSQCSICHCFMMAKTWLEGAHCPLENPKW